jgi:uncharacterized membrane protein YjgN (DUF898 family)
MIFNALSKSPVPSYYATAHTNVFLLSLSACIDRYLCKMNIYNYFYIMCTLMFITILTCGYDTASDIYI